MWKGQGKRTRKEDEEDARDRFVQHQCNVGLTHLMVTIRQTEYQREAKDRSLLPDNLQDNIVALPEVTLTALPTTVSQIMNNIMNSSTEQTAAPEVLGTPNALSILMLNNLLN